MLQTKLKSCIPTTVCVFVTTNVKQNAYHGVCGAQHAFKIVTMHLTW